MATMSVNPASTNSVDLSRLPAPDVVEPLSYEQLFDEMVTKLQQILPSFDATVDSDPAVKVLQVAAYFRLLDRQNFNDRARQLFVAYATDGNLDQLGALFGVARLQVAPADPVAGTAAVYEDDDSNRRRIVLAPESYSVAGPEAAYIYHALSAAASILDASATSPAPGTVLVSILSRSGNGQATPDQLDAVDDALATVRGNRKRPLTDNVVVASASIVDYLVQARLVLFYGPDETLMLAAAQASLAAYLLSCRKLGRDVTRAGITGALMVEGVQNVVLTAPPADVLCDDTQASNCVGLDVAIAGYGE
nr:baseplate J/gp47 family protein [Sphingomonas hylomeconis]